MKKTLIVLVAVMMIASSAFAGVSFLTASPVGEGKIAVLGMYATNHQGNNANGSDGDPSGLDTNSIGARVEYGLNKDVDLLAAYSVDSFPNSKSSLDVTGTGNTISLGVKYALAQSFVPADMAVVGGYEQSNAAFTGSTKGSITLTTLGIGCVFSKQMGTIMPYGGVSYKSLSQVYGKNITGGTDYGAIPGTGLAFNLGCAIGIAANQAVLVEYNTENQAWTDAKKGAALMEGNAINVSGISLGYVYMF